MNLTRKAFGRKLRAARKRMDLSQTEIAAHLDLRQNNISRYESGSRLPEREIMERYVDVLGLDEEARAGLLAEVDLLREQKTIGRDIPAHVPHRPAAALAQVENLASKQLDPTEQDRIIAARYYLDNLGRVSSALSKPALSGLVPDVESLLERMRARLL